MVARSYPIANIGEIPDKTDKEIRALVDKVNVGSDTQFLVI